ncbi:hypothetical protein [Lederbergia panacisoli]|uniref:hypothetical protein n=1 Tax=Lederbergia panacisoli TaxID=1255251 RepID=UPI00214C7DFF|nr:hypothetical protein [Lederbergia panacisoli]MCR2823650.1 hypothetical protein [Lederbergia panacisoli]
MDGYRSKEVVDNDEKGVKVMAIPQALPRKKINENQSDLVIKNKKKKSALEISDSIGVYGAFGRTLSDLHKQGR